MKANNILLLGGIGLIVYYLAQLGIAGSTVNFVLQGVQPLSLTKIRVTLMVQNVSNANVTLYALTGNITVNGNNLGSVSDFTQVEIPATSQVPINLDVDLSILNLPGTIMSLVNQTGNDYNFVVTGNANINKLVIPFTVNQNVTV